MGLHTVSVDMADLKVILPLVDHLLGWLAENPPAEECVLLDALASWREQLRQGVEHFHGPESAAVIAFVSSALPYAEQGEPAVARNLAALRRLDVILDGGGAVAELLAAADTAGRLRGRAEPRSSGARIGRRRQDNRLRR